MEWLTCVRTVIDYMEDNLERNISVQDVADQVYLSPFFLQKGFSIMTGYGISEYLRNRRLYEAALRLRNSDEKVIDIALTYGYETTESFAKAFSRFHGATPSQVRSGAGYRSFLPLHIKTTIQGGNRMNYKVTRKFKLKLIGFERIFEAETSYAEIPKFWDELCEKYANNVYAGNPPANPYEQAIIDNCIGEYAACVDDVGGGRFRYLVAGRYAGGEVPQGMSILELPESDWAIFDCTGPLPEAMQSVNTRIFKEWLPGNPEYELSGNMNIEWYDTTGDQKDPDYHTAIWIPVKKKS